MFLYKRQTDDGLQFDCVFSSDEIKRLHSFQIYKNKIDKNTKKHIDIVVQHVKNFHFLIQFPDIRAIEHIKILSYNDIEIL